MKLLRLLPFTILLGLLIPSMAHAVVTKIHVTTPAGPPLQGATLRILTEQGEPVQEKKSDDHGTVVIDLPNGKYRVETVDGKFTSEVKAGGESSMVVPVLYGILDNVDALTDYFQKFHGTASERADAWKLLHPNVAHEVEARLRARLEQTGSAAESSTQPQGGAAAAQTGEVGGGGAVTVPGQGSAERGAPAGVRSTPTTGAGTTSTGGTGGRVVGGGGGSSGAGGTGGTGGVQAGAVHGKASAGGRSGRETGSGGGGVETRVSVTKGPSRIGAGSTSGTGGTGGTGGIQERVTHVKTTGGGESGGAGGSGGDGIKIGGTQIDGTIPGVEYDMTPLAEGGGGGTWTDPNWDPTSMNPVSLGGSVDSAFQHMMIELQSDTGGPLTVPSGAKAWAPATGHDLLANLSGVRVVRAHWAWSSGVQMALPSVARRSPAIALVAYRPSRRPSRGAPQSEPLGSGPGAIQSGHVQIFLTSTGNSTGDAFHADIVNPTSRPVTLNKGDLVVEPLDKEEKKKAQRQISKLGSSVLSLKLQGYCVQHLKLPPVAGQMYRIAATPLQQKYEPMRKILSASQRLFERGQLNPDVNPEEYFHSIRQWAMWTEEEDYDKASFLDAFIEHTKKNLEASGRKWSPQFEKSLREALSGRWDDIQKILREAGL